MKKRDYLFQSGAIASGDPEKISQAALVFDKNYHRQYQKTYRQQRRRVELYFKLQDFQHIEKAAQQHECKVPGFIRGVLKEYLGKTIIVRHPKHIDKLTIQIKRMGNNLNQIARYAHTQQAFDQWHQIREELTAFEKSVLAELTQPKDMAMVIRQAIAQSRLTTNQLKEIFQDINQIPP